MRVLIVNTSERMGGAAVAANRLMKALNKNGVKAKMLVRDKDTTNLSVCALPQTWQLRWHFLWERLCIWMHLHLKRTHLFAIDIANCGTDITSLPEFKEADIIHRHWINQGMLSLKGICKILQSGKHVAQLREELATPHGMTFTATNYMEQLGFRAAVIGGTLKAYEHTANVK